MNTTLTSKMFYKIICGKTSFLVNLYKVRHIEKYKRDLTFVYENNVQFGTLFYFTGTPMKEKFTFETEEIADKVFGEIQNQVDKPMH